ncbi:MAG: hypothetical protein CMO01_28500, partial [Thalassobius sp.]|nr:hypothetical protein [Thalassovita sp.]
METMQLCRGGEMVTLHKVSDCFAIFSNEYPKDIRLISLENSDKLDDLMEKLRQTSGTDIVSHVYISNQNSNAKVLPLNTITIQFENEISHNRLYQIFKKFELEEIEKISYLPNSYTTRLTALSKQ